MQKRLISLLLLMILTAGCTSMPPAASTDTVTPSALHRPNVVLPDFVYGYPMHY
jgi:hypothetical protein